MTPGRAFRGPLEVPQGLGSWGRARENGTVSSQSCHPQSSSPPSSPPSSVLPSSPPSSPPSSLLPSLLLPSLPPCYLLSLSLLPSHPPLCVCVCLRFTLKFSSGEKSFRNTSCRQLEERLVCVLSSLESATARGWTFRVGSCCFFLLRVSNRIVAPLRSQFCLSLSSCDLALQGGRKRRVSTASGASDCCVLATS